MGTDQSLLEELRRDFRGHLERFYAQLKLAPPYHHVERALAELTAGITRTGEDRRGELLTDTTRRWALYREAFVASGLPQKHRGIIIGLIQSGRTGELPPEYDSFLSTYDAS